MGLMKMFLGRSPQDKRYRYSIECNHSFSKNNPEGRLECIHCSRVGLLNTEKCFKCLGSPAGNQYAGDGHWKLLCEPCGKIWYSNFGIPIGPPPPFDREHKFIWNDGIPLKGIAWYKQARDNLIPKIKKWSYEQKKKEDKQRKIDLNRKLTLADKIESSWNK